MDSSLERLPDMVIDPLQLQNALSCTSFECQKKTIKILRYVKKEGEKKKKKEKKRTVLSERSQRTLIAIKELEHTLGTEETRCHWLVVRVDQPAQPWRQE